jgi:iron(III) transport system substrate-binding protein
MTRHWFKLLFISAVLLLLARPAAPQTSGEILKAYESLSHSERRAHLIEQAKKEARLVFYGSLGVDASAPLLEKFRQAHPYISIGHYRSSAVGVHNRIVNEARGGKHEVDVIELSAGPVSDLIKTGLVDAYRSPESKAMRPEFIDPRHLWNTYHYLVVGLAYNTSRIKENEVPKSYDDLLLPRWKGGRISLDRDDGDVFGSIMDAWGEKRGLGYFHKLAKQEVIVRSGHTLQVQLLAAGETDLVPWSHAQRPLMMAERGAPLGVYFMQPVLSKAQVLLLSKRAQHPHAAALFVDWALSEEGQNSMGMDLVRSPVRIGAQQKYAELGKPKTKVITPEFLGQNYQRYTKIYHEVFNVR